MAVSTPPAGTALGDARGPAHLWWLVLIAGVLSILVGIAAMVWPGPTLLVVGLLFGIYLALWGAMTIAGALTRDHSTGIRIVGVLLGVLGVLVGLLLMVRPDESVLTVAWVLGFWFVLLGVLQIVQGFAVREGRVGNLAWGVLGLVAGAIILVQPGIGLITLVWIVSITFVVQGVFEVIAALALRKLNQGGVA